jgi:hypothetical protein
VAILVIKEHRRGASTYTHGLYVCEGLTEGIAFVVECKKSKITLRIMSAFQFSTMHIIIDAFSVIRRKEAIECTQ